MSETTRPDPIPNSAVKRLSAHGTVSQDPGESVAARPAKIIQTIHSLRHTDPPARGTRRATQAEATSHHATTLQGDAGWSSPVARQAHNLKAAGSNPAPATRSNAKARMTERSAGFLPSGGCG